MATHEYWQFAFVREIGQGTEAVSRLGFNSPLKIEHSNLPVGSKPVEDQPLVTVSGDHIRVDENIHQQHLPLMLNRK